MKHIISICLILFAIGCKHHEVNSASKPFDTLTIDGSIYNLDSITESIYNTTHYHYPGANDTIPLDTAKIKISQEGIRFYTQDNESVLLKNDTIESDAMVSYLYQKTLSACNYMHVKGIYYEWTVDYLVSLKNGKQIAMWDAPLLSPNRQYIMCASADLESGEMPNGLQLFKIQDGQIVKVFDKNIDKWEPYEIKWETDSTIVIKRAKLDNDYNQHYDYLRMKLRK
jgi:hypothetical protein